MSDIQARGAVVSWSAPTRPEGENNTVEDDTSLPEDLSYEVAFSINGKDGKYQNVNR